MSCPWRPACPKASASTAFSARLKPRVSRWCPCATRPTGLKSCSCGWSAKTGRKQRERTSVCQKLLDWLQDHPVQGDTLRCEDLAAVPFPTGHYHDAVLRHIRQHHRPSSEERRVGI